MVHDGRGNLAGERPGFLHGDNEPAERARVDAYRQYAEDGVADKTWARRAFQTRRSPSRKRSQSPEAAVAAAYAEYDRTFASVGANDRPAIHSGGAIVNPVAIAQTDLDARIAAAFADGATSIVVAVLNKDTEQAATSASEQAERARNCALDPTLSSLELTDARKSMDDVAFKRDRLQAATGKLRERLAQLKDQEENARPRISRV